MKLLSKLLVFVFSIVFFAASYASYHNKSSHMYPNVWVAVQSRSDLTTFARAIRDAGLVRTLQTRRTITVFAPTNRAFNKLPEGELQALLQPRNRSKLRNVLLTHVIRGRTLSQTIRSGRFRALNGHMISINQKRRNYYFNDVAKVSRKDVIVANNGTIRVIDRVIIPGRMMRR